MLIKQFQEKKTKLELELQPSAKLDKISETSPSVPSKKEKPVKKEESSTSFYIKEKFRCSPGDLFECLVNPARVKAYAGGDAIVSREKGGTFKLFGRSVEGENLEVVKGSKGLTAQMPPHKLVQKWQFASWPILSGNNFGRKRFGHRSDFVPRGSGLLQTWKERKRVGLATLDKNQRHGPPLSGNVLVASRTKFIVIFFIVGL